MRTHAKQNSLRLVTDQWNGEVVLWDGVKEHALSALQRMAVEGHLVRQLEVTAAPMDGGETQIAGDLESLKCSI